jgi:very-short-patch-repair endonuclease
VETHFVDQEPLNVLEVAEMRPEARILELAGRQHGAVTSAQLLAAGWSPTMIRGRVRAGWLRPLHRGVYLVGPLEPYPAAVLWDWRPPREGPMHVIAGGRSRDGLIVHHTDLDPRDITRRHGIPVTSAARTILDLAATGDDLDKALNEAYLQRRVSTLSLNEQFSRYPHHRGTAALRKHLETEPKLTRSDAEIIALGLIRRARLPEPETNVRVEGYECDLVWREQRLVVEVDSWAFHSMRSSFERDRRRDQHLVGAGWRVVRLTGRQLTYEPELVVATLTRALAVRP